MKFQTKQGKTVRLVAHTRYPLAVHFIVKLTVRNLKKKCVNLRIMANFHPYLQSMAQTSVKIQIGLISLRPGDKILSKDNWVG